MTLRSRSQTLKFYVKKFGVKDFISLYLLNVQMDLVDTLHVGTYMYWSEVLYCTITVQPTLDTFRSKPWVIGLNRFSGNVQLL